ncbi:MAG TPA: divergent polysaccharide deacetylase family protein [Desulfobacteraceae bacterium]|nr:divergent polysaccharide deacetylase family protein [Desulfobacteraceae bacterium]
MSSRIKAIVLYSLYFTFSRSHCPTRTSFIFFHYIWYFLLTFIAIRCMEPLSMEETYPGQTKQRKYDRRAFLAKSLTFLAGTFVGLDFFRPMQAGAETTFPRIALIIDDIGSSVSRARAFAALGIPITFSILPQLRYSRVLAQEMDTMGHEIMLHQPMEPYCHELDPGPGAVYISYADMEIEEIVKENLAQIPEATGVNNHMGSRFTSCPRKVLQALKVIKENDLFFVDSLTTCHSKAYTMARRLHMRTAPRNIFLDHDPDLSSIRLQLRRLKAHALTYGAAIGIGHPHIPTLAALHEFKWELEDQESTLQLVPVSRLL